MNKKAKNLIFHLRCDNLNYDNQTLSHYKRQKSCVEYALEGQGILQRRELKELGNLSRSLRNILVALIAASYLSSSLIWLTYILVLILSGKQNLYSLSDLEVVLIGPFIVGLFSYVYVWKFLFFAYFPLSVFLWNRRQGILIFIFWAIAIAWLNYYVLWRASPPIGDFAYYCVAGGFLTGFFQFKFIKAIEKAAVSEATKSNSAANETSK